MNLKDRFKKFKKKEQEFKNSRRDILVVDGSHLFKSQFTGNPMITASGVRFGGAGGFVNKLHWYIREFKPERVIVVMDGKNNSKNKRKLDSNYKADRGQKHKMLKSPLSYSSADAQEQHDKELILLSKILKNLPITLLEIPDTEADDVIAYITHKYFKDASKYRKVIISADKDFIQLIDENTVWYNSHHSKKKIYDLENYREYWDAPIENISIIRSVEGDASDNLSGVKGVKYKSLVKLLPEIAENPFENIEQFIELIENRSPELEKTVKGTALVESTTKIINTYLLINLKRPHINMTQEKKILDLLEGYVYNYQNLQRISEFINKNKLYEVLNYDKIRHMFILLKP